VTCTQIADLLAIHGEMTTVDLRTMLGLSKGVIGSNIHAMRRRRWIENAGTRMSGKHRVLAVRLLVPPEIVAAGIPRANQHPCPRKPAALPLSPGNSVALRTISRSTDRSSHWVNRACDVIDITPTADSRVTRAEAARLIAESDRCTEDDMQPGDPLPGEIYGPGGLAEQQRKMRPPGVRVQSPDPVEIRVIGAAQRQGGNIMYGRST